MYKDGEVHKVKNIDNPNLSTDYTSNEKDNNFNGYAGNIDYYNYVLNKKDVKKLYIKILKNILKKLKGIKII